MRSLLAVAVIIATISSCTAHEARSPETSDAAECLSRLAEPLKSAMVKVAETLPVVDRIDWDVRTHVVAGKASIELIPSTSPSIRGGGGRYEFDCTTRELKLVEGYR